MALAWGMRGWEVEVDESLSATCSAKELCSGTMTRSHSDPALAPSTAKARKESECESASTAAPCTASSGSGSQQGDEPHSDAASEGFEKIELTQDCFNVRAAAAGYGQEAADGPRPLSFGQEMAPQAWAPAGMIVYIPMAVPTGDMQYMAMPTGYEQQPPRHYAVAEPEAESPQSAARSAMEKDIAKAQLEAAARRAEAAAKKTRQPRQQGQQKQAPPQAQTQTATSASACKFEDRTSIMLRNLPNDYTLGMLLALLDAEGFSGRYDFAYLPVDFTRWAGFGYAFVNMASHEDAVHAWKHFQGFDKWQVSSQKVCEVCWGDPLQGLAAHVERYRNSPVMHEGVPDSCKPAVFRDGRRIPFPPPTKRIRAPRAKQPGHGRKAESALRLQGPSQKAAEEEAASPSECAEGLAPLPAISAEGQRIRESLREAWEIALSRKP